MKRSVGAAVATAAKISSWSAGSVRSASYATITQQRHQQQWQPRRQYSSERPHRAMLYLPGSNTKILMKGTTLHVDSVCMDLEDSVAASQKATARQNIIQALANSQNNTQSNTTEDKKLHMLPERYVRINPVGSGYEEDDIRAIFGAKDSVLPDAIVLPKVESIAHLDWVESRVQQLIKHHGKHNSGRIPIIAIIETAKAIVNLPSIVQSSHLCALIFGADDFAASIGASRSPANDEVAYARAATLTAAKAYNLDALDMVCIDFNDNERFRRECTEGARMGFNGKQVIHPNQLPIANECFAPSKERIEWAEQIVTANMNHNASGKGAFQLNGQMIDAPTVKQAEVVLAKARLCRSLS